MTPNKTAEDYRPAQRKRGRRILLSFEVVNTFSFSLLTGNLITLLLLRLGANPTVIGILSAFPYVSFLFMPFAKFLVPKWGLVKTFGRAWTARYFAVIPIVFAPLLVAAGHVSLGLGLILGSYLLFQVMRGFGLVSTSPLSNELSAGKDRGEFLSRKMLLVHLSSIISGLAISVSLGENSPLERYSVFLGIGIVLGFFGCALLFRIPEPPGARFGARSSFIADVKEGFKDAGFRRFILAYGAFIFVTSLGRPFLLVYAKEVYLFGDDAAMILTVVGSLGAIVMAQLSRMVLDRLGGKPMMVLFTLAFLLSNLPLVFLPPIAGVGAWLLLSLLFFTNTLGGAGGENASQAYFFGITKPAHQFNLGMLYYLVMGACGSLGSFLGGILLDTGATLLEAVASGGLVLGLDPVLLDYSLFFGLVVLMSALVLYLTVRMASQGSRPVGDALSTIFSPRDLRTMNLLKRLDRPTTIGEEAHLLQELPESNSDLAVSDIVKRLRSPLHAIRSQALLVLERLPSNRAVEDALIKHVREYQFGSAYRAARILGQKGVLRAVPALRDVLSSEDYLLIAYAAGALGDLKDEGSRPLIEELIKNTDNYLILVQGIGALKEIGHPESLSVVLSILLRREVPPYIRDEVVFGLAGILGLSDWLYPRYVIFLENAKTGAAHFLDDLDAVAKPQSEEGDAELLAWQEEKAQLASLVAALDQEDVFAETALRALEHLRRDFLLSEKLVGLIENALSSPQVLSYIRFRYFIAGLAVYSWSEKAPLGFVRGEESYD